MRQGAFRIVERHEILRQDSPVARKSGDDVGLSIIERAIHEGRIVGSHIGETQPVGVAHAGPFEPRLELEIGAEGQLRRDAREIGDRGDAEFSCA